MDEPRRRLVVHTVRFRVTLWATAILVVGMAVTSVVLVTIVRRDLVRSIDVELGQLGADIAANADDREWLETTFAAQAGDETLIQVIRSGTLVAASPMATGLAPIAAPDAPSTDPFDVELPLEDPSYRAVITSGDGTEVVVARSLEEVGENVATVTGALLAIVPVISVAWAALVWISVGRTLQPVEAIREEVETLGRGLDLRRRVPVPPTGDEVARLASTMNEMLGRMQVAVERQRSFVADASHELRIPLTRLRTMLEVEGAGPSTDSLIEEVDDLQALVEDLLFLARADAHPPRHELLDLDEVVRTEVRGFGESPITTELSPVMVRGDANEVGRAVRNLLDNAIRHALRRVDVRLALEGDEAILSVSDDGPGVPPDEQLRIFDRFTRLDSARSAEAGGTGLGLAIAKSIAERHGGSISVEGADPGARFVIRLPASL